jgi:tight adherence protein B
MRQKLEFNQPIEKVFAEFAEDWKTEDILHFVEVFQTAKRTGGDLIAITRLAAEKIGEKIEVRREIDTMIAGKKMEGRIMNLIPLGMILYFWLTSPGFLDCLYQSSGRIVMTVLMLLYVFAYRWSEKISDISV